MEVVKLIDGGPLRIVLRTGGRVFLNRALKEGYEYVQVEHIGMTALPKRRRTMGRDSSIGDSRLTEGENG